MLKNAECASIIQVVGAGSGRTFDLDSARYGKIIFMADADSDGAHIRCLLATLFFRYMRPLVDAGRVFTAVPPLHRFELTNPKKGQDRFIYTYSDAEYQRTAAELTKQNQPFKEPQRYKGLGEMDADQLAETTMSPRHRTLRRMTVDDGLIAETTFEMLMGNDVAPRKTLHHRRRVRAGRRGDRRLSRRLRDASDAACEAEPVNVAEHIVERLHAWGVGRVYGYPGTGSAASSPPWPPAARGHRATGHIDFVQVRHEETAGFAATADVKYGGNPIGCCVVTGGPGALHALNGVYDALLDRVPIVAVLGQTAETRSAPATTRRSTSRSVYDDVGRAYLQTITDASQVQHMVDRACRTALAERRPAVLIVPSDVQERDAVVEPPDAHGYVHSSAVPSSTVRGAGRGGPGPGGRGAERGPARSRCWSARARSGTARWSSRSPTGSGPARPRRCSARPSSTTGCRG